MNTSSVTYDGNSQGGILGGAVLSLSTDIRRGVLGVTGTHQALLQIAYGDHQVTMVSAEIEARTIGARLHCPALSSDRLPHRSSDLSGLQCIDYSATNPDASAIVICDTGRTIQAPPAGNEAPDSGLDPHEDPRATVAA